MTARERMMITLRTYPVPSARYVETVCTAGITEDRLEWRRLYPVPLRYLEEEKQFRTYDRIELEVGKGKDGRLETRTPNLRTLRLLDRVDHWHLRREWVDPTIAPSIDAMKSQGRTIGPVAVDDVLDLVAKKDEPDWSPEQQEKLKQMQLFDKSKPLEKVPFTFRFIWRDMDCIEHDSLVLEWEMHQTWRKYRARYEDPIHHIREVYLNKRCGPDNEVSFYMGNLAQRPEVFAVCGLFYPPRKEAGDEILW